MSGSLNSIYNNTSFALYLHTTALTRLQEQASTGSQVNRGSDAPSTAHQILGLTSQKGLLQNYVENLSQVTDALELSSTAVSEIMSSLTEVKLLTTQVASGVYDEHARERISEQINDLLEQIVLLANTRHVNEYIFGGGARTAEPYVVERTDGEITKVTYQGGSEPRSIEVAPGVESSAYHAGDRIFRMDERTEPVFTGLTGAQAGTGTSSVRGDVWMTVIHDGSNYQVSIDDGISFTTVPPGGDVNQAVTHSQTGQILYVDTTQINNTGVELVRVPGTYDVFNTLITIRDLFANDRNLSDDQIRELQNNVTVTLDEVNDLLVQASVSIGAKIGFLSDLEGSLKAQGYSAEDEIARLEEVDVAQIAIDISRRQLLYQMSLSAAGKIMSMSLLDFI